MSTVTARRASIAVALALLLTLPLWVGNSYYINIASQILLWAVLALALNVLVGYAGLVSLGHAGLFAMAGYSAALLLDAGYDHLTANLAAIAVTLATAAVFAVLALRATGIGFLMITLAIGQILWGIAYRWASLTNGDNGINVPTRPAPFGLSLASAGPFYYATLAGVPSRRPGHGDLRALAVRGEPARHARPGPPHDRARLQRLADPVPGHPVLGLLGRRRRHPVPLLQQVRQPAGGGADDLAPRRC